LKIDEKFSLVMTIPETKKFSSDIDILTQEGERISTVLEVNKPFSFGGYKIYQLSYDDKMGKWSDLSVLELVRDPWLPFVYIGIFMMIAGAFYMFWMGNKITKNQ
ncbi:MAG: cytochrome c biogenesis protein ResB, partial [Lutibacter sp.]|nr:cytochrome c biogenesis protein ResB [Lutibacter sp.]